MTFPNDGTCFGPATPANASSSTPRSGNLSLPPTTGFPDELFVPLLQAGEPRRLTHSLPSVLCVMAAVLDARVSHGDSLRAYAASPISGVDLAELVPLVVSPALQSVSPAFHAAVYGAALVARITPFDTPEHSGKHSVHEYIARLSHFGDVSNAVFVTMLIYVDRLTATCPALILTTTNVQRILAACFVVASKVFEDRPPTIATFSLVTGINPEEMLSLESAVLKLLNYRTFVTVEEYATAETAFMAEALDTPVAFPVLSELFAHDVSGIPSAFDVAALWKPVFNAPSPKLASLERERRVREWVNRYHTQPQSSRSMPSQAEVGRPVASRAPCAPPSEEDSELREKIRALAIAQLSHDFPAIDLRQGFDAETEWQILGLCEEPGLIRFRKLRAIIDDSDTSDTCLSALRLRDVPFRARNSLSTDGGSCTFTQGLGPNGQFLASGAWVFALGGGDDLSDEGVPDWIPDHERWRHSYENMCFTVVMQADGYRTPQFIPYRELCLTRSGPPGSETPEPRAPVGDSEDHPSLLPVVRSLHEGTGSAHSRTSSSVYPALTGLENRSAVEVSDEEGRADVVANGSPTNVMKLWFSDPSRDVPKPELTLLDITCRAYSETSEGMCKEGNLRCTSCESSLGLTNKNRWLLQSTRTLSSHVVKKKVNARISIKDSRRISSGDKVTYACVMSRLTRH